jgi:H+-translocating NAD(P) transhydrogenase subunit alpha
LLITVPKETRPGETRVAATPETVKKFIAQGHRVKVQSGAGLAASAPDEVYVAAGGEICSQAEAYSGEIVLKVRPLQADEVALMKPGQVLIGMLEPFNAEGIAAMNTAGLTAFALEAAPRISRAQSLDVLSSQANVAGYKAVLMGANTYGRLMPMLMTAAGTVKAARVVILGVGVAGLQAIATAKRLGAVVEASDVRPATKEQVESLGGKFIDVPFETDEEREIAQGTGGYARPMPASWMARQALLVAERLKQADIVITTALIPGRPAPKLISAEVVRGMKPGSVIVDMAAERGGNCELTVPGEVAVVNGVNIIGITNIPATVPADSSALYARNLLDFMKLISTKEATFNLNMEDEIVVACLMCHRGEIKKK